MNGQKEIMIKMLMRSVELRASNKNTLRWIALEVERTRWLLGNPRALARGNKLYLNGFSQYQDVTACALWIGDLLLKDAWEKDPRSGIPGNETWYKKRN